MVYQKPVTDEAVSAVSLQDQCVSVENRFEILARSIVHTFLPVEGQVLFAYNSFMRVISGIQKPSRPTCCPSRREHKVPGKLSNDVSHGNRSVDKLAVEVLRLG
jgi:hypothetical protein